MQTPTHHPRPRLGFLLPVTLVLATFMMGGSCQDPGDPDPDDTVDAGPDGGTVDGSVPAPPDGGNDGGESDGGEVHPTDGGMAVGWIDGAAVGTTDGGSGDPSDGGDRCNALWQGDVQGGTALADETNAVWVDEQGNVFTVGYENGIVGQTNIEPTGNSVAVVAKYGKDGVKQWQWPLDTSGTDTAEHLVSTNTGHVLVVGRTTGALPGFSNAGQFDVFAVELDGDGASVSTLQSGDERPQHPLQVGLAHTGTLMIAGYEDLFVQHSQVFDSENGFVGGYALSSAEPVWRWRSASTDNPDRVTGLTLNAPANDELYTSGFKFFQDDESVGGAFVRRYDLDGTQRWFTQIGMVATEVEELLVSPTGELFAAGSTQLPLGGEGRGLSDAYIASLSRETGEVLWVSKSGTDKHDFVTAFAQGPTGDLYVAGDTFGAFAGFTNQGERDLFILRFSSTGQLLGVWQHGTDGRDHAAGIWVDGCNNVYLVGFTEGSLIGKVPAMGRDGFLMKVNMPAPE